MSLSPFVMLRFLVRPLMVNRGSFTSSRRSLRWMSLTKATYLLQQESKTYNEIILNRIRLNWIELKVILQFLSNSSVRPVTETFVHATFVLVAIVLWTQNILIIYFEPKTNFLYDKCFWPKIFLDPRFLWTQNSFGHKIFIGHISYSTFFVTNFKPDKPNF